MLRRRVTHLLSVATTCTPTTTGKLGLLRTTIAFFTGFALLAADPQAVPKILNLFNSLNQYQATPPSQRKPISFSLAQDEVNAYLAHALQTNPRPGLKSLRLKFFPQNYISSYTILDFDAVERWKPGTIPALMRPVLNGQKAVWVDIRFNVVNGAATYTVEKAYYEQIRIPAIVVEKMIAVVAARQPEKYDTSKPVPLPFNLKNVWTENQRIAGHS